MKANLYLPEADLAPRVCAVCWGRIDVLQIDGQYAAAVDVLTDHLVEGSPPSDVVQLVRHACPGAPDRSAAALLGRDPVARPLPSPHRREA